MTCWRDEAVMRCPIIGWKVAAAARGDTGTTVSVPAGIHTGSGTRRYLHRIWNWNASRDFVGHVKLADEIKNQKQILQQENGVRSASIMHSVQLHA